MWDFWKKSGPGRRTLRTDRYAGKPLASQSEMMGLEGPRYACGLPVGLCLMERGDSSSSGMPMPLAQGHSSEWSPACWRVLRPRVLPYDLSSLRGSICQAAQQVLRLMMTPSICIPWKS